METQIDVYLKFPLDEEKDKEIEEDFGKLRKFCGSVEDMEEAFDIDFSCGDGKYLSDLWEWSESGDSLKAAVADEELEKYDGNVCTLFPPRRREDRKELATNKWHRFTAKYSEKREELVFFLNNKETFRKWVG